MAESSNSEGAPVAVHIQEKVPKIRVVFMGTPLFAATILQNLIDHHYQIVGVVTQPDKPTGRTQELQPSHTKQIALSHNLPVLQPNKFDEDAYEALKLWKPDLIIVAAYGKILPRSVLSLPGFGCVNVHASLLPKWRGASPIHNVLLAGETETGVTLMLMNEGVDTGDIIASERTDIDANETRPELETRLATIGAELLSHTLASFVERKIVAQPQNSEEATLCQLIDREDGHIFWNDDSQTLYDRYRALTPWPGIFTFWKKNGTPQRLKLLSIGHIKQAPQIKHATGEVFEIGESIGVQTGTGILLLKEVQLEGKERVDIQTFVRGYRDFIGSILE
ncbi:MAG: methionyl-tRNA formyltransferase [Candidatus Moranbacteria bacterium]|nr:methionyl-tRNA formyltransferase [Candidatus Moranbacteria bacterium]